MLPREHGAYGQLAFPLVTAFAVAGVTVPALLMAVGVVAAFLAHEPLLVLLGRRGDRTRRAQWRRAAIWMSVTGATAVGGVLAALVSMAHSVRWWLILPVVPTAILFTAITAKREKSALGEIAVALVFSLVSVPICLAAGGATRPALAVGLAFSAIFVADTLAVRAIVLKTRGGGDPRAARATRVAVLALTSVAAVGFVVTAWRGLLPWTTLVAATPGLVGAVWLTSRPPSATQLRAVGWALVMTSAAAAIILIADFAGAP